MLVATVCLLLPALVFVESILAPENQEDGYRGHQVWGIRLQPTDDLKNLTSYLSSLEVDIWRLPRSQKETLDVRVGPDLIERLHGLLSRSGLQYVTRVADLGKLIRDQAVRSGFRRKRSTPSLYGDTQRYLSYNEILAFLDRVAASRSRRVDVQLSTIGQSTEDRDIKVIKISRGNATSKPAIVIDGGIHAREWIAPATVLTFIYKMATNPSNDPAITDLVEKFTWYFVPLLNPDGYEFSRVSPNTRLWRKTRSVHPRSQCRGVDANRNFAYQWNPNNGGSTNPCEEVYSGRYPLSEPETRALAGFLRGLEGKAKAYVTYHSYGQYMLYPWGYAPVIATDKRDMEDLAVKSTRAMQRQYKIGSSALLLYSAAGGSDDFAKGTVGIKYAYTVELPPDDDNNLYFTNAGFLLDEESLPAVANDAFRGIQALARELHSLLLTSQGTTSPPQPVINPWWAGLFSRWV